MYFVICYYYTISDDPALLLLLLRCCVCYSLMTILWFIAPGNNVLKTKHMQIKKETVMQTSRPILLSCC